MSGYAGTSYSGENTGFGSCLLWAMGLFIVGIIVMNIAVNIPVGEHSVEKHGSDPLIIEENCSNGNIVKQLFNKITGRTALCVQLNDPPDPNGNRWGVRIVDGDSEITSFIKENMPFFYQVIKYLNGQGYK